MKQTKRLVIITLIGLFLIALPIAVFAANKKMSQSVYIGPEEIVDGNFIKAGNIIDISGAVNGDVIVAGNSITISGPVAGDVIAAASRLKITGPIGGSIRAIASTIEIDSEVERNVWAAAANISLGNNSQVGWDVFAAAGSLEIKGPVGGNVWATTGSLALGNEVGKKVIASLDTEGQIILYPQAKIGGDLVYYAASDQQLVLKEGAQVIGETTQKEVIKRPERVFGPTSFFFKIISLFSLLVVGLVLISLVPKKVLEVQEEMVKRPGPSLGWGLVYFFIIPIIVILLMITIIGIPLALIIIPLYLIGLYVAKVLAGFALGLLLLNKLVKEKYKGSLVWPLVFGLIILIVITSIPIFGWLIKLLLIWWALGAAIKIKKETLQEYR